MKLKNPFTIETRELFRDVHNCWQCHSNGQESNNTGLELHHIYGRISASAFNASPLCGNCHRQVTHTSKERVYLVVKTINFLRKKGYSIQQEDVDFLASTGRDIKNISKEMLK